METPGSRGKFHQPSSARKVDWDISGAHDGTTGFQTGVVVNCRLEGGRGANLWKYPLQSQPKHEWCLTQEQAKKIDSYAIE
jgi:hypothetical protein